MDAVHIRQIHSLYLCDHGNGAGRHDYRIVIAGKHHFRICFFFDDGDAGLFHLGSIVINQDLNVTLQVMVEACLVHRSTELSLFIQRNGMTALCRKSSGFHAGRTAADDADILFYFSRFDSAEIRRIA